MQLSSIHRQFNFILFVGVLALARWHTCHADTEIILRHDGGATEYCWYVNKELLQVSSTTQFILRGDWPYPPEAQHSFTAIIKDGESEFESAPFTTTFNIPPPPAIESVRIVISLQNGSSSSP